MTKLSRQLARLLEPLRRRIALLFGRGVITMVDDQGGIQRVQIQALAGETLDRVERFQEYGLTSRPLSGAMAVFASIAGVRSHSIVLGVEDRRYRLKGMTGGEVALYDDQGQVVYLTRDGIRVEGLNLLLATEGVLRLEGDVVEIHAATRLQTDVAGRGEAKTHQGGTAWLDESWETGASVTAETNAVQPPGLDSQHPERAG
ncbi:MAG: phage baseplate assembly protein V [Marivibrio sp.]|uniref:phage baseplate assembly protein V n=1 Tax=Marivibrio sp. TaxID=2039719 RepID=UPI0032F05D34